MTQDIDIPQIPLVDGDTLMIDGSRYGDLLTCDRLAYYKWLLRIRRVSERAPLTFGRAIHLALKLRYVLEGSNEASPRTQALQMKLLERFWVDNPTQMGDHRTLGFAQDLIVKYNRFFKAEPFELFRPEGEDRWIVEEPLAMPLGTFRDHLHNKIIKVVWTGRIDLPFQDTNGIWIGDHKTASVGGETAINQFQNHSSLKGYCWMFQERFKTKVRGGTINHLIARKPGKTDRAKGVEFQRYRIMFSQDRINEWREEALRLISQMYFNLTHGFAPMRTTQCANWGRCDFLDVCNLEPSARLLYLKGDGYEADDWDPLREEDIDLAKFLAEPLDESYYSGATAPVKEVSIGPDISELIAE